MRVLLTGALGQLGRDLRDSPPDDVDLTALDRESLDITDTQQMSLAIEELRPELIINAAAYTAVDRAEKEQALAFAVNSEAVEALARLAVQHRARLIHLSTDFVFDGRQSRPYRPDASTGPLGVYGASKLAGEQALLKICGPAGLVLRTAWVYSRSGHNFVKTMLRLMSEREELTVVADQIGSPTWTRGLAEALWSARERTDLHGVHHWTDAGVASWYDFAIAIQEEANDLGLLRSDAAVIPIATDDFPTAARRPANSILDTTQTRRDLGLAAVHWRRQLRTMLRELHEHGEG